MRDIIYILKRDLKNIKGNRAMFVMLAALAFLPSLYAWVNIYASWDPYANTEDVPVAISSLDEGAELEDTDINVGDEVVLSLTKNNQLGWEFVSEEEAIKGVKHGDYYAAVIIPEEFSEKLISVTTDTIEKPKIDYYINEKINAIAPKVTEKGASGIVENIQSEFIEETNNAIVTILNSLGIELDENYDNILKIRDIIYGLEDEMPNIYAKLQLAEKDLKLADVAILAVNDTLENSNDLYKRAQTLNDQLVKRMQDNEKSVERTLKAVTDNLTSTQKVFKNVPNLTKKAAGKGESFDHIVDALNERKDKLDETSDHLGDIHSYLLEQDQNLKDSTNIADLQSALNEDKTNLEDLKKNVDTIISDLEDGKHPAVEVIEQTQQQSNKISDDLDQIAERYENSVYPAVVYTMDQLEDFSKSFGNTLNRLAKVNEDALTKVSHLNEKIGEMDSEEIKEEIERIISGVDNSLDQIEPVVTLLRFISNLTDSDKVKNLERLVTGLRDELIVTRKALDLTLVAISKGEEPSQKILKELEEKLENTGEQIDRVTNGVKESEQLFNNARKELVSLDQEMRSQFNEITEAKEKLDDLLAALHEAAENPEKMIKAFERVGKRIDLGVDTIDSVVKSLASVQEFIDSDVLTNEINRIKTIQSRLTHTQGTIDTVIDEVNDAKRKGKRQLDNVDRLSSHIDDSLGDIISFVDEDLTKRLGNTVTSATTALGDVSTVLDDVHAKLPNVQRALNKATDGVKKGKEKLAEADEYFPEARDTVTSLANKIRTLEKDGDLEELIDILSADPQRTGEFFAEPVLLDEHALYKIPNYGSAMNPFYTTLSLWVGALLLVSAFKVDIDDKKEFKSSVVYLGRLVFFAGMGIIQSTIVTLGNIFLLNAYVVDKLFYVLFGIIISTVFVTIVYTLVSILGNTGKVLSIILMVMQLGGSGGTFPIQMAPKLFQHISNFLPFTHAISLLREAIGGIIWEVVFKHIAFLFVYFILALILGLLTKKFLNRSSDSFMERAKKSKMVI